MHRVFCIVLRQLFAAFVDEARAIKADYEFRLQAIMNGNKVKSEAGACRFHF